MLLGSWRDKVVAEPKFNGIGNREALSTNHIQSFIYRSFARRNDLSRQGRSRSASYRNR